MKRVLCTGIVGIMMLSPVFAEAEQLNVIIDGKEHQLNVQFEEGVSYVPLEDIVELMNGEVQWEKEKETAIIGLKEMPHKELVETYTKRLEEIKGRKIVGQWYLSDDYYAYAVTDQVDVNNEKILIMSLKNNETTLMFEGGDFRKNGETCKTIYKVSINQLKDNKHPNICVFRKNDTYTKVSIYEINEENEGVKGANCYLNNTTKEYTGDEAYRYVFEESFGYDYLN